jgi:hypothetical protein
MRAFPLCSLLLLCACGDAPADAGFEVSDVEDPGTPLDSGADTGTDDTGDDTAGDTGDDTAGQDTGEPPPVEEVWAMLQSTRTLVDSPVGGGTAPADTRAISRLAWRRQGTAISWEETVCSLEASEVHGTQTTFPFVSAIPVRSRAGSLSEAATGASFTAGPWVDVLGARLEDSEGERLPTRESDPRQWDQDEDGEPGVTVHVEQELLGGGDVWVAQRTRSSFEGVVVRTDRIEGHVELTMEQVMYGASTWWLELDTNSRPDTAPEHNFFLLQGIDPTLSCEEIVAQQERIFGR